MTPRITAGTGGTSSGTLELVVGLSLRAAFQSTTDSFIPRRDYGDYVANVVERRVERHD